MQPFPLLDLFSGVGAFSLGLERTGGFETVAFCEINPFALSELADFAVYTPLQQRRLVLAVLASGLVGLTLDSIAFLWLAFGSLDFLAGQIIGKAWMVLLALPLIRLLRDRDARLGIQPV